MNRKDKQKKAAPGAVASAREAGDTPGAVLGTLFGVGVGPGDPGLVTLAAAEVIRRVPTVAYPVHKQGAGSRALETVRGLLAAGVTLLPLLMPMTKDSRRLNQAHDAASRDLVRTAADGRDVAYLSLGDPLFYSTFGYLAERFPGPVKVISGVSAMSATAAALGQPLAAGDTPLAIVTGRDHKALEKALEMDASVVILKPRSLSRRSLELIGRTCGWERACAAIELGGPEQQVIAPLDAEQAASLPYFAVMWIRPAARPDRQPQEEDRPAEETESRPAGREDLDLQAENSPGQETAEAGK